MILIVDGHKDIGIALGHLLHHAGFEALAVTSGSEALAKLKVLRPSLVVLDVNMPEMDGLTVLKTIKEHQELKDLRVVMFSAESSPETKAEAKRLGAMDYLSKCSFDFTRVVDRICELAERPA